jgi:murein L,D-transpeptidase YafK
MPRSLDLLILTVLLCAGSTPALAMSYLPTLETTPPADIDRHGSTRRASKAVDRVVVKKAERRLYLMQGDRPLRTYEIALGYQPVGHKGREGDGRTPEGRYAIDWRNDKSRFYKALHISYPNARDRWRAEHRGESPGGMILIHGQPKGGVRSTRNDGDWTLGCIAVSNAEMDEIWSLTRDGTPIEILP